MENAAPIVSATASLNLEVFASAVATVIRTRGLDLAQVRSIGHVRNRLLAAKEAGPGPVLCTCVVLINELDSVRNARTSQLGLDGSELIDLWRALVSVGRVGLPPDHIDCPFDHPWCKMMADRSGDLKPWMRFQLTTSFPYWSDLLPVAGKPGGAL